MKSVLQVGDQSFSAIEVLQRLASYHMLPQLAREIIIDQAIADVVCTDEEQEQSRQHFFGQHQLTSEADLQAWLKQNEVTPEQLQMLILRPAKLETFKRQMWGAQLGNHFLKQKQHLDQAIYYLIRNKNIAVSQELYFRIEEGESTFEDLARQYSEGPEAQTGGLIGPRELSQAHPKLAQLLRTSQPGQVFQRSLILRQSSGCSMIYLVNGSSSNCSAFRCRYRPQNPTRTSRSWLRYDLYQNQHPVLSSRDCSI
jgi:parvulin-like peptidyl-prolyl isomerase